MSTDASHGDIIEIVGSAEFGRAVVAARRATRVEAGGVSRLAYDVSGIPGADGIPHALVILLENVVRRAATDDEAVEAARRVVVAGLSGAQGEEIEFMPARVLFQDFTGVPVFVDFAAMRDEAARRGMDPSLVNPKIPCTLVVDHSVIADVAGCPGAAERNERIEADRNRERFAFLKWASGSFDNVEIVPPGGGICHQLNIERFCRVVSTDTLAEGDETACFDTLVGTDSHTTTANGIGVLGWGVGGIEAEAAALGQPISLLVPPVIELRLSGSLPDGASGMDLALTVCQLLRSEGVVGSLVEVTGDGVAGLTATQRSCVANMTPEYGATTTLFPVDERVCDYLALTGRDGREVAFARAYCELQGTFGTPTGRRYARTVELDLASVEPSLAGPSRPHNRVAVAGLRERFEGVARTAGRDLDATFEATYGDVTHALSHGAIAIAAITSCTTATDPAMMVAAGLLARAAAERGLRAKPWVKCVLAPGSRAASLLLDRAGLSASLEQIGFYTCGFGCMSCIGNSGEVDAQLKEASRDFDLASVLSGNRNFDGRISPDVAQNYLAQPALVLAYALAGTVRIDLTRDPICQDAQGEPVYLSELMPTSEQVERELAAALNPSVYQEGMASLFEGSVAWRQIEVPDTDSATFAWDPDSTYIRRAPYFDIAESRDVMRVDGARALALLGDFVTTDHISPAGSIAKDSPAARYLTQRGVSPEDFNTYGSRRGNHEVMARGAFANVRLQNALADGRAGGWTRDVATGEVMAIFDAAESARACATSLVVVAGKMYGSGSSRDWAGKGPLLLGVRAVIAESFERIHRSNLVQMGVLPLEFLPGEGAAALGLAGDESFDIAPVDLSRGLPASPLTTVRATRPDGSALSFDVRVRIDTPMEAEFMRAGGILPYVLAQLDRRPGDC